MFEMATAVVRNKRDRHSRLRHNLPMNTRNLTLRDRETLTKTTRNQGLTPPP